MGKTQYQKFQVNKKEAENKFPDFLQYLVKMPEDYNAISLPPSATEEKDNKGVGTSSTEQTSIWNSDEFIPNVENVPDSWEALADSPMQIAKNKKSSALIHNYGKGNSPVTKNTSKTTLLHLKKKK